MPDIEICGLEQDAVLWKFLSYDGHGGPVLDTQLAIKVRWKWQRSEMLSPQNATVSVDATAIVALDVPVDSLMWLGRVEDFAGTAGPLDATPSGVCQVKTQSWTPDLKGRTSRRTLGLVRWRGPLPAGVG
jgi:hypothetical protein